jgi:hypothetical protein
MACQPTRVSFEPSCAVACSSRQTRPAAGSGAFAAGDAERAVGPSRNLAAVEAVLCRYMHVAHGKAGGNACGRDKEAGAEPKHRLSRPRLEISLAKPSSLHLRAMSRSWMAAGARPLHGRHLQRGRLPGAGTGWQTATVAAGGEGLGSVRGKAGGPWA